MPATSRKFYVMSLEIIEYTQHFYEHDIKFKYCNLSCNYLYQDVIIPHKPSHTYGELLLKQG